MLLFIPTHNGLPDYNQENWVHQELFTHLYELFKQRMGV